MQESLKEDFNIFRIFEFEKDEVKHSRFIAELLNPINSNAHSFLDELIKILQNDNKIPVDFAFNTSEAQIEVEKAMSLGRIDILLCDDKNNYIVIENKIDATDQKQQLGRYYKYVTEHAKANSFIILYLTKEGMHPQATSLEIPNTKISLNKNQYTCISYKETILKWLKKCKELSTDKPNTLSLINQYLSVLEKDVLGIKDNTYSSDKKSQILENFIRELCTELGTPIPDLSNFYKKKNNRITIPLNTVEINGYIFCIEILNNLYYGIKPSNKNITSNLSDKLQKSGYKVNNDGFMAWKYPYNLSSARMNFRIINGNTAFLESADNCKKSVNNLIKVMNEDIKNLKSILE